MTVPRNGKANPKEALLSHFLSFASSKWAVATAGILLLLIMLLMGQLEYLFEAPSSSYSYTLIRNTEICPKMVRIGSRGEGGKSMCGPQTISEKQQCVVYSFGIRDNFRFDHDLAQRGCTVHGFDPSPSGLQSKDKYEQHSNTIYHSYGLGALDQMYGPNEVPFRWPGIGYLEESNTEPWQLKRLPTIMKENNNEKLTILKVDVEGAEWDAMLDIIHTDWDELYMEIHFPPGEYRLSTSRPDGGLTIARAVTNVRHSRRPARNVSGPIDRIGLLKALNEVADLYYWEPNYSKCAEVYFKRKSTFAMGTTIDQIPAAPSPLDEVE